MGLWGKIKNVLFEDDEEIVEEMPVYTKEDVEEKKEVEVKKEPIVEEKPIEVSNHPTFNNVKRDIYMPFEDDVLEEDLMYHGNGWFRWNKSNDTLIEYSTMDFRDVPIAHIYVIKMKDSVDIAMAETNGRSVFHFIKE